MEGEGGREISATFHSPYSPLLSLPLPPSKHRVKEIKMKQ